MNDTAGKKHRLEGLDGTTLKDMVDQARNWGLDRRADGSMRTLSLTIGDRPLYVTVTDSGQPRAVMSPSPTYLDGSGSSTITFDDGHLPVLVHGSVNAEDIRAFVAQAEAAFGMQRKSNGKRQRIPSDGVYSPKSAVAEVFAEPDTVLGFPAGTTVMEALSCFDHPEQLAVQEDKRSPSGFVLLRADDAEPPTERDP